jgi:hypothetical protein
MTNLFLPNSTELTELSKIFKIDVEELKTKITSGLQSEEIELEEGEDAGRLLSELFDDWGFKVFEVVLKVLGRSDNQVNELFGNLYYKHVNEDCPECGCETETETDGCWGQEWEEKKCVNSNYDYSESGEPDWDLKRDIALDR